MPWNLVVIDTATGKELEVLPISKDVDDIVYDPAMKRIYAVCDGTVDVYQQNGADGYKLLRKIASGPVAKTGLKHSRVSVQDFSMGVIGA